MGNTYIVYEISLWDRGYDDYPILKNSMFGAVKLVKSPDIDTCKFSGDAIGFDRNDTFSIHNGSGKNAIFFGKDTNSSVPIDNKKKSIL